MTIKPLITRSHVLRLCTMAATGLAISLQLATAKTDSSRPNIILIIGDDISFNDFGCYGHPHIRTPHIDGLAADGLRFTNAYLTTSQCSPTRCSLITGRYPHNTGAPELHTGLPEGQVMFPALLKQSGYYTVAAGKWHMGKYARSAFDKVVGGGAGGEELWVQSLQQRPKDQPFFMWLASYDAHRPWQADKKGKPHTPEDAVIPPFMVDTPGTRIDLASYYDEIQRLDRCTGEIVSELKNQGVYENTIILFMADNGRPFPRCKTRLYDSGVKTPLVIHWPGQGGLKQQGKVSESLVSSIDLAPTILELAGIKAPPSFQGVSMSPLLADPQSTIRKYVFAEHNWHAQIAHERMIRRGDYVYIRNAHPQLPQIIALKSAHPNLDQLREMAKNGKLTQPQMDPFLHPRPAEELFHVGDDPHQINNLAGNPERRPIMQEMRKLMDQWQLETGDTVPTLDQATPDRYDRSTGKRISGKGGRPNPGVTPGETRGAAKINHPGPR